MRTKGKRAWLITWEGDEAEDHGRCKVVTILRPQFGKAGIPSLLRILFSSEYNYTLCEKTDFGSPIHKDPFFLKPYRDTNPEFCYGYFGRNYLCARQVKHLRCEESKTDCLESTLFWTELAKFIPNPKYGPTGPPLEEMNNALREVVGEREAQYTYSIRLAVELAKARREKRMARRANRTA